VTTTTLNSTEGRLKSQDMKVTEKYCNGNGLKMQDWKITYKANEWFKEKVMDMPSYSVTITGL